MTLALALGMPLGAMLRSMTSRELAMWWQFYQREPFGGEREDFHAGIVASSVLNSQRARATDHLFVPSEFMPKFWRTREDIEEEKRKQGAVDVARIKDMLRQAGTEAEAVKQDALGRNGNAAR